MPRRAAINSYGFTGVNAHVVIEEYPDVQDVVTNRSASEEDIPQLTVLSAKTAERLKAAASNLKSWLENHTDETSHQFRNIAWTLQTGREAMEERLAMVAGNSEELIALLGQYISQANSASSEVSLYTGNTGNTGQFRALLSGKEANDLLQGFLASRH